MFLTRRKDDPPGPDAEELHVVLYRGQAYGEDDQRIEFRTAAEAKAFLKQCVARGYWATYRREAGAR